MVHTAYTFGIESKVSKAEIVHEDIEVGCLIKVIQRGLQYMELEANVDSQSFEVLTAADILKAKSTDELRQLVRERREDRAGSQERCQPQPFDSTAVRKVTNAEAFGCPWSPDGTKLATYVHESTAHVWSAGCMLEYSRNSSMQVANLAHGQITQSSESVIVTQLVWAPDGKCVTTGCSDGTVCTWACDGATWPMHVAHERLRSHRAPLPLHQNSHPCVSTYSRLITCSVVLECVLKQRDSRSFMSCFTAALQYTDCAVISRAL